MNQNIESKQSKHQNLKRVLKVTVDTVRTFLQCDRVVIYNVKNFSTAAIIAESKGDLCSSLAGKIIKDPFLEEAFGELYDRDLAIIIDDVYTSDVSNDGLRDLEKLEIKSVAIAPIYVDNKLLAFLAAHQCVESKPWNSEAASFLAEQAREIGLNIAKIIKPQQVLVSRPVSLNRNQSTPLSGSIVASGAIDSEEDKDSTTENQLTLIQQTQNRLFNDLKLKIANNSEPQEILQTIVTELRLLLNCDRVLIYGINQSNHGVMVAESSTAQEQKIADDGGEVWKMPSEYLTGTDRERVYCWSSLDEKNHIPLWYRSQSTTLGINSGLLAPIINNDELVGLLTAHQYSNTRIWQTKEIEWIAKIAEYTSNMINNIRNSNPTKSTEKLQPADLQKQLEKERKWAQHFADVVQKIRQSLNDQKILKTSVSEIHKILDCDRALIYTLTQDSYGKIAAESVSPGWTKAEGRVIKDPCFEARYLEKYRDGRFRAWSNIYESGMSTCHIEQLEKLEVKANLVVPIINEGKLFGLLVAQQCSGTRQWQQAEILWMIQIATQIGFALDNSQLIADAQRLRQQAEQEKMWTEYFSDAVQQIRQSLRTKDIYKATVREVRRVINCDRVVVYGLTQNSYGKIVAESVAHGWTKGEGRVIKDPCFEARYLDKYRDGRVRVWNDIYESGMSSCYIEQLENLEVKANLVVPIVHNGKLFGLLVSQQCSGTRQWQQPEIDWLTQIALQVALTVENAQMLEKIAQNTQVTRDILARAASSSANIQLTVQSVTAGFANLNNSCQNFAANISKVKDLSKQLAQQSMNMSRIMNLNQAEVNNQNATAELADHVFSLMQELFEATARIDPLFDSIKTEIQVKAQTLELETQSLIGGVDEFQTASHNLEEIVTLNEEMSNLMEKISNSLESQIKSSTFAGKSVRELAEITERISRQSVAIMQSLNQLVLLDG